MKNAKLEIRKLSKAGFSLVEMLVVIAVIGIIAAIAIPNIGQINDNAKTAVARRTAQTIASVAASAQAAGAVVGTDVDSCYTNLSAGVSPTTGAFVGKKFVVPSLPTDASDEAKIKSYLSYDSTVGLQYTGGDQQQ